MQTVISVFEDRQAAQRAVDRLLEEGFKPDDVHLQEGTAQANTAMASIRGAAAGAQTGSERGVLSSFGYFFVSLFDQDPPSGYPDRYSEAVRRGHPVVMIDATDPEQAQRALAIVQEVGTYDIDERGTVAAPLSGGNQGGK